jgi:hypothetical protein
MAPIPGMQKVFDWLIANCSCILKAFPCNKASLSLVRELLGLESQLFIHDTIATTVSSDTEGTSHAPKLRGAPVLLGFF